MSHLFVSYSRKDSSIVDDVISQLEKSGYSIWLDREGIHGGTEWRGEIVRAIKECGAFIILLSENSIQSRNVRKELTIAETENKLIYPVEISKVIIPEDMAYQLIGVQRISFLSGFEAGIKKLIDALNENSMGLKANQRLAKVLEAIQFHNEAFVSVDDLSKVLGKESQIEFEQGYISATIDLLDVFGVISKQLNKNGKLEVRAKTEISAYFIRSLGQYLTEEIKIIRDWVTKRAQDNPLPINRFCVKGVQFLYGLEKNRLNLNPSAKPIRKVKVAQVIIKAYDPDLDASVYLSRYDKDAGFLQLIGGKFEPTEDLDSLDTIRREIREELEFNNLVFDENYSLEEVVSNLTVNRRVSTTYGVLSGYEFTLYHAKITQDFDAFKEILELEPNYQWVSQQELINGITHDKKIVSGPYKQADKILTSGFSGLVSSFE